MIVSFSEVQLDPHLRKCILTLFDMGFFSIVAPRHNFAVIAPMVIKFGTGIKPVVFYTMVAKNCDVTIIA